MSTAPLANLPARVDDVLEQDVDEARIQRLWVGTRRRREARTARPTALGVVALALLVPIVAMSGGRREPGFLRLSNGALPLSQQVEVGAPEYTLTFEEGSRIQLMPGTRLVPLRNDSGVFETEIDRGVAQFRVTPGLGRQWRIRMGHVVVAVVGTEFVLEHDVGHSRVFVTRGVVRVSGVDVGGERLLHPGQEWRVDYGLPAEAIARAPEPRSVVAPEVPGCRAAAPNARAEASSVLLAPNEHVERGPSATRSAWRTMAQHGEHRAAYDALGPDGLRAEMAHAEAKRLALLADVARFSGHPSQAVEPLERILANYPRSPQAPLAAVVLGRLEMDRLGHPARARAALERAVQLGIPTALQDDVRRRLARLATPPSRAPDATLP